MIRASLFLAVAALLLVSAPARAWDPQAEQKDKALIEETIQAFLKGEPRLKVYFDQAYGYAVFPTVDKAGLFVGGAYGKGKVFVRGQDVGHATLSQASAGLEFGFEAYSELIFFGDKKAFEDFKKGKVKFAAGATAYAIKEGAAAVANYNNGVAVFVKGKGGLMADASIGGQSFTFVPTPKK